AAGTIMCLSTFATSTFDEIAATGVPRWFQLYVPRDAGVAAETIAAAADAGFEALVLTVDAPVLGRPERDHRTAFTITQAPGLELRRALGCEWARLAQQPPESVFGPISASITWADVERFAAGSGLPVILKGVVTAEDARLACEHGAAAVVVSNHGGRQLDGVA